MSKMAATRSAPSVPLLAPEEPTAKKEHLSDWILRKRKLALYTVLLLFASVGNTIFFKQMTSAMPNYGWYLTQLSCFMYVPIFASLAGTSILQNIDRSLLFRFAMMGLFDGLSGIFGILGGVHTSGTLQVLLGQAVIPVTILLSVFLIGKRYHLVQHLGAMTIVMGIVIAKVASSLTKHAGGDSTATERDIPLFNFIYCLALLPTALSTVFKEIAFRGFDGDLDVNVLQFWVAAFQFCVNFAAMPVYSLSVLGAQQVPLAEMGDIAMGGTRCLFLREDQIIRMCGLEDQKPCDHCESAYIPVFTYLAFNLALNVFAILVIKNGSAALSFLVSTLRMPLSSLAFSSTLIMGNDAVPLNFGDIFSLVVILLGLCTYRYGARLMKHQLRREAEVGSEELAFPSPTDASPLSPDASPQGEREARPRWQFIPVFTSGSMAISAQPQVLLVKSQKPKARTADRVRTDLIRRLGAASPLHSPNLRHLSPSSESGDRHQDSSLQDRSHGPVPDFSLSGLPP